VSEIKTADLAIIARAVADAAFELAERERRAQSERIYGMKTIAAECGVSHDVLTRWVNTHGFPLDKDPRGYSVRRWNMERWFEARRRAVESLKR
jgi:hypothetical protein